jgi:GntR family transcriptional repressor for pyruvate dehydrogenase complex
MSESNPTQSGAINWSRLKVDPTSISDELAARLEQMILEGELAASTQLPPERELQRLLGVSRVSIREALHDLELRGLIDRKPGRGTIVVDPARSSRMGTLLARLSDDERSLLEIMDFRAAIEPPIAARAADRATPRDVRALRDLLAEMDAASDVRSTSDLDEAFHAAIARASHNSVLVQLLDITADWMRASRHVTLQSGRRRQRSLAGHRKILDAIAARDVTGAADAMAEHIEAVNEVIAKQQLPDQLGRLGRQPKRAKRGR